MKPFPSVRRRVATLSRRLLLGLAVACLLLLALRAALPSVLRYAINERLAKVDGYAGRVDDVNLQLFRGAYQLEGVNILKHAEGGRLEPLLAVKKIDFSLAWRELFHGRVVSDIVLTAPKLRITTSTAPTDAKEDGRRWQDAIQDIFPVEITRFQIIRGDIRFIDETSSPRVDVPLRELELVATGLRNQADDETGPFPASLAAQAVTAGDGRLTLFVVGDPLATAPRFKLKLDLVDVRLTALNDFLEAYANVDVSAGTLKIYAEAFAQDGAYEGYVKPFFKELEFKNQADADKNIARRVWEKIVAAAAAIVENDEREQVATRIPFSGRFGKTDVGVWATIRSLLRNGFIKALNEGRESEPAPKTS